MTQTACKYFKVALIVTITLLLSLFAVPYNAFADSGSTGAGGSGGGSGNKGIYWEHYTAVPGHWNTDDPPDEYLTIDIRGCGGAYGDKHFDQSIYGSDTHWAACICTDNPSYNGYGFMSTFGSAALGGLTSTNENNWKNNLEPFFADNLRYIPEPCHFYSYNGSRRIFQRTIDGTILNSVWIDSSKLEVETKFQKSNLKIVKYWNDGDSTDRPNEFDYTGNSAEWKYYNAPVEGEYHGITPPTGSQSHNYSNKVNILVQQIVKHIVIKSKPGNVPGSADAADSIASSGGGEGITSVSVWYEEGPVQNLSKNVTYTANIPDNSKMKVVPFNLNRNNYAQNGDGGLDASWFYDSNDKLEGSVNNEQNITDDTHLNALDINNDTPFNLKFTNNQLGMPSIFDFHTVAPPLNNTTWEYQNGGYYANNKIGDLTRVNDGGLTGYFRYDLQLNSSIGPNEGDLASLIYNDEEKLAKEQFTFATNNDPAYPWRGGDWIARFVKNGIYTTDNESSIPDSSKYKEWWTNTYTQERFYEYGVEYRGKYNTSGIQNPWLVAPTNGKTASLSGAHFSTNGLDQRGLYVTKVSNKYAQPVLYGHWDVKTVAGDTKE